MKCDECGKRLSRTGRCIRKLLGQKEYHLEIVDDDMNVVGYSNVLCQTCGGFYEALSELIDLIGEEETLKFLDSLRWGKKK